MNRCTSNPEILNTQTGRISIAFEGSRGTGKTTVVESIVSSLCGADTTIAVNRGDPEELPDGIERILEGKNTSVTHQHAIQLHTEWQSSFEIYEDGHLHPIDPNVSWRLSYQKFLLGVFEIVREVDNYMEAQANASYVVLDRDLDTVIAYGAAELILSDPDRYKTPAQRRELIELLWGIVKTSISPVGRYPADITIYLTTDRADEYLIRGHDSKRDTEAEYDLDPFQTETQKIIDELYNLTFEVRKDMYQMHKIYTINVDGKSASEVAKAVQILIMRNSEEMLEDIAPLKLPKSACPQSIEELVELICSFSTGAAFPSLHEVKEYGVSNCVYNNVSLVEYAEYYGLGKMYFVEVSYSNEIGSSPTHWCAIQIHPQHKSICRVVDVTPFNEAYIGEWVPYTQQHNEFYLQDDRFSQLTIEDPHKVYPYMELANKVEIDGDPSSIEQMAVELISNADNESKYVFSCVRYSRLLGYMERYEDAVHLIRNASDRYPKNLVLLREVGKLINIGYLLTDDVLNSRLNEGWKTLLKMAKDMPNHDAHLRYYDDIRRASKMLD